MDCVFLNRGRERGRVWNVSLNVGRTRLGRRGTGDEGLDEALEGVGEVVRLIGASRTLRLTFSLLVRGALGIFCLLSEGLASPVTALISSLSLQCTFGDADSGLVARVDPAFDE